MVLEERQSWFTIILDTKEPVLEIYTPSYVQYGQYVEFIVTSSEQLNPDRQSAYVMFGENRYEIALSYNEELNEFENVKITNYDELSALIYRIIVKYSADSAEDKSFGKYIKTKSDFEFSSFTYISSNFSDDDVKMINEEIEAEIKNMIVVTKNVSDLPESNDAGINITEVPIGKISSAINCIEL